MNFDNDTSAIRPVAEAALSAGERLYWVGRPNPLRSMRSNLVQPFFGLVWMAVVYFMFTKFSSFNSGFHFSNSGFTLIFQLVFFIFLLAGLRMVFSPVWNYFKARSTVYAVTDERAMIINRLPVQSVRSYSARNIQKVERRGSDDEGDVIFGSETHSYMDTNMNNQGSGLNINFGDGGTNIGFGNTSRTRTVTTAIGFFGISQPREVESLLLDLIQRDGTAD
jgi:hypothetical protein